MNFFKKIKNILSTLILSLGIVSCEIVFPTLQKDETKVGNNSKVVVSFYNSSSNIDKPIYINANQSINEILEIPSILTEKYTDFIGSDEEIKKYDFNGWIDYKVEPTDTSVMPIEDDYIVTESISLYTCYKLREVPYEFRSENNVVDKGTCPYGREISFHGQDPTKPNDKRYSYKFKGWRKGSRALDDIGEPNTTPETMIAYGTQKIVFYAVYSATYVDYSVKWMNGDKQIGEDETYSYNDTPVFKGVNPTKESDSKYNYSFKGWNTTRQKNDVGTVIDLSTLVITGATTFYAVYEQQIRTYTVQFYDNDGNKLSTYSNKIGTAPKYNETTIPKKAGSDSNGFLSSESCLYEFLGWSRNRNSTTADGTLLTTKINSDNNGEPYKFYTAFKKTVFGAITGTNTKVDMTMNQLYNSNILYTNNGNGGTQIAANYTTYQTPKVNGSWYTRAVNLFRQFKIKTFSLYPDRATILGSRFRDDLAISGDPSSYSSYAGKESPLETLIIHEGFTQINGDFQYNKNLKTIYLPSTLTFVDTGAFKNIASSNVTLNFGGTATQLSSLNPSNWINYSSVNYNVKY